MIDLVIAMLIAMSGRGDPCAIGEPVENWAFWVDEHPYTQRLGMIWVRQEFQLNLYQPEPGSDEIVLFVFDMENYPHGRCARRVYRSRLIETLQTFEVFYP